jgi:hypothetical protein
MAKVEDTEENVGICQEYCGPCPSFPNCEGEWLFCAREKSKKPLANTVCMCPSCDVQIKYKLTGRLYCQKGAAT